MTETHHQSILLAEYMRQVEPTDRFSPSDVQPLLLGLFGEVGSIMAAAKKLHREKEVYAGFRHAAEEEFGDALWYFTALCRRLDVRMDELFSEAVGGDEYSIQVAANDLVTGPISRVATPISTSDLDGALLQLGEAATALFGIRDSVDRPGLLANFTRAYLRAVAAARVAFAEVVRKNIAKTRGRFVAPEFANLPNFDERFPEDQRLPQQFEITIDQRGKNPRSYLRMNGVFIGDPLTDNILDPDGYRFHDVFHFAHAAIMHWSPTFRALIKHKRKDDPVVDEAQDSGRAVVVEEGLAAWIFSRAKEMNFFAGQSGLSFDLLKTVQQFVSGYEVEACPLSLWEITILRGYDVFRQVKQNSGGVILCDRARRSIEYKPLPG